MTTTWGFDAAPGGYYRTILATITDSLPPKDTGANAIPTATSTDATQTGGVPRITANMVNVVRGIAVGMAFGAI
jgi:hypothetical protein